MLLSILQILNFGSVGIQWGEYGETRGETVTYGDTIKIKTTPYNKKVDVVLDSQTGQNYFSEITAFLIFV